MQLRNLQLEIQWNEDIDIKNLRKFIISKFPFDSEVIRWSINEISFLDQKCCKKLIKVNALFLN